MTTPYDRDALSVRVNYAAQCIRKGSTGGRSFDTCFEMNDGEFVVTLLVRKAERDPDFAAAMLRYWRGDPNYGSWKKTAAQHAGVSDKTLRARAHYHRCVQAALSAERWARHDNDIEAHWLRADFDRAFSVVKNPDDWKAPIDATLPDKTTTEDLSLYASAIRFFTATEATITYSEKGFRITAPGYRAGPAGDH